MSIYTFPAHGCPDMSIRHHILTQQSSVRPIIASKKYLTTKSIQFFEHVEQSSQHTCLLDVESAQLAATPFPAPLCPLPVPLLAGRAAVPAVVGEVGCTQFLEPHVRQPCVCFRPDDVADLFVIVVRIDMFIHAICTKTAAAPLVAEVVC